MSGSSVASDSLSSTLSSSRSGTTSPDRDSHASSSLNYSSGHWERSLHGNSLSPVSVLETLPETLSNEEVTQIETFYRGLFSQVYVCPAVASLYLCEADEVKKEWVLHFSEGIPVVVQVTRPDRKSVHLLFAERETGFALWRDVLTTSSGYRSVDVDYHDFRASNQKTRVGLRISSGSSASKFLQHVVSLISNPTNFGHESKSRRTPKKKTAFPKKSSISPPCCFAHLVHVNRDDELTSLTQFVVSSSNPSQTHLLNRNPRASVILPGKLANSALKGS